MPEFDITPYRTIFFDFDGVVADTNSIKKTNIRNAVSDHLDDEEGIQSFVDFFTGNNGIPREEKVNSVFDRETAEHILKAYGELNRASFTRMKTTPGFHRFFKKCKASGAVIHVLSGGDAGEITEILQQNNADRFDGIFAGPDTKSTHLERLKFDRPALLIGDSRHDHEVAMEFGLDFIFMKKYTQFSKWEEYFRDNQCIKIITNFEELL